MFNRFKAFVRKEFRIVADPEAAEWEERKLLSDAIRTFLIKRKKRVGKGGLVSDSRSISGTNPRNYTADLLCPQPKLDYENHKVKMIFLIRKNHIRFYQKLFNQDLKS